MTTVILFSGGADSLCAYWIAKQQNPTEKFVLLYIDSRARYSSKEMQFMLNEPVMRDWPIMVESHFDLSSWELPNGIVPFRNGLYALAAARHGSKIWLISTLGDGVTAHDKDAGWARLAGEFAGYMAGHPITVEIPFRNQTKSELVADYLVHGGPRDLLLRSISCYSGGLGHCGWCKACLRKFASLAVNSQVWAEQFALLCDKHPGLYPGLETFVLQAIQQRDREGLQIAAAFAPYRTEELA